MHHKDTSTNAMNTITPNTEAITSHAIGITDFLTTAEPTGLNLELI